MLPLENPDWQRLTHAYGCAADIPEMLRMLAESPQPAQEYEQEPWFTLWSSLCHQGDAYDASYAAVPHLLHIAMRSPSPVDSSFFHLPAAIDMARHNGRGPAIPPRLEAAYHTAIGALTECVGRHLGAAWEEADLQMALVALAVAKGHHRLAEAIMNLDDYWISRIAEGEFE